jgi:L-alanine-DL-glutamate epimerase-like enolase superfamily enzyme
MKIARVESFLMSYVMPEEVRLPFWGGLRTIHKRDAMLVRVTADNGLVGYAPGPAHERAQREIYEQIAPFLAGKDPRRWRELKFPGTAEVAKTYHAVEIAVLDLVARYEECPLCEVMGGRKRDRIKLYGSAGMYMAPEAFADEAAAIAAQGYPAYKMRPALGPEEDLRTVALMREAVGPDIGLMIDAHTWWRMGDRSYTPETIGELARAMKPYAPTWLEEPLPPEDHAAYRALRKTGVVPIATGEHEQTLDGFLDLCDTGAADIVQMDVLCQGGFEMARRIFERVEERGLRFAFHSWGTMLEVLAAAHVGVCRPESVVEWLECPVYSAPGRVGMYPFETSDAILAEPLRVEAGHLVIPDEPGLGIAIDERVIEKYPYKPGPWSYFRQDSPKETIAVTGDHSVKWIEGAEHA